MSVEETEEVIEINEDYVRIDGLQIYDDITTYDYQEAINIANISFV